MRDGAGVPERAQANTLPSSASSEACLVVAAHDGCLATERGRCGVLRNRSIVPSDHAFVCHPDTCCSVFASWALLSGNKLSCLLLT